MKARMLKHYGALGLAVTLASVFVFGSGLASAGKLASRSALRPGARTGGTATLPKQFDRIRRSSVKPQTPRATTAQEALKLVRSGHRVLLPTEVGTSQLLVDALADRAAGLKGRKPVSVLHPASLIKYPKHDPAKLQVNGLFVNSGARPLVDKGLKVIPTYLSEIPKLLEKQHKPNVILLKVAPPDKRGYVSTGVSAGVIADLLADPKVKVIAEVNPNMPRTRGATRLHQSHIDRVVYATDPMPELKWGKVSAVDKAIGKNVAKEVPNGATLQLGIGPIQQAVAQEVAARGKRILRSGKQYKLRVRSEMIDDGLVDMVNAGVISKGRNAVQLGFAVGTKKLYDLLGNDKRVQMVPTRVINDVMKAGERRKLRAINSGVHVDLLGQACSEAVPREVSPGVIRPVQYSGVGGQVDFFRAAHRSEGGKGILTLRSTAKNGTVSSISLDMGSQLQLRGSTIVRQRFDMPMPVTTNRYDVDTVVTEWGKAELKGKDVVARAQALVKIAHPSFRAELAKQGMSALGGEAKAWQQAAKVTAAERHRAQQFARDGG